MKTRIKGKTGHLDCKTSTYARKILEFPTDSLKDWYPLSVNYEYKYDPICNRLYLAPLENKAGSWGYGITSTQGRVGSKVATFEVEEWYCKEIAEDNQKVFKLARKLDLLTLEDEYTLREVKENYQTIRVLLDNHIKPSIMKRMEQQLNAEEVLAFKKMDYEAKDTFMYQYATPQDDEKLLLVGKLYSMTNFMRKRVE